MSAFSQIRNGRECLRANHRIPRHVHDQAYVAIVLAGGYEECGSQGRFRVGPGDVLLHSAFDAHLDRFQRRVAQILNLVAIEWPSNFPIGEVRDPDLIARTAKRDPAEALGCLREQLREKSHAPEDWPDLLARDLLADPDRRLDTWANEHGLAPATVSRGFGQVFGQGPASFRTGVRARRAFALIVGTDAPLASVAATAGFADQAHMSRCTRALTGRSPGAWRKSKPFKTGHGRAE